MIVLVTTVMIAATCFRLYNSVGMTLRHAAFQTVSVMTNTGFSTVDFAAWPAFAQTLLIILMFIGACAGSTSGGLKVSRIVIYFKMILKEIKYISIPIRSLVLFERGATIGAKGTPTTFIAYLFILVLGTCLPLMVFLYDQFHRRLTT